MASKLSSVSLRLIEMKELITTNGLVRNPGYLRGSSFNFKITKPEVDGRQTFILLQRLPRID